MPREITPQCLVVLYHKYGDSGRKPSKGPNDGNNQGGNGNGGPGGGDDGDDGDDHDGSPVPSPSPAPEVNKKKDKKKAPGDGGGGGDDDPDKDSDDSDEKFVRRMKKFLGGGFNQSGNDEKPKVKEADTIKLPAISRVRRHIETGVSKPERP